MARKQATIIYNPMSGRPGRRAASAGEMVRLLGERDIEARALATAGPNDATRLAREAVAAGHDIIISYGGDGTLNEVIQGMAQSQASLAIWAGGTANVVARDLGLPAGGAALADMIAAGKTRRIALGLARRIAGEPGGEGAGGRYFVMFAGIGLDASIARGVNRRLKRFAGEFAYWVEGVKHLLTWQADPFTVEVDGRRYESAFTLIGKGKGYGGGFSMTPNARLEEPWFEVYILPRHKRNVNYLRDLAGCARGRPDATSATLVRGQHIIANSGDQPWVEVDGELIGPLPMRFDAVPDALSMIVP